VSQISQLLEGSSYGYCLVVNERRVVLGRVRRSAIALAEPTVAAESVMEPGPSTKRPNTPARELAGRLSRERLRTAVVTTPRGVLIGVFHRDSVDEEDVQVSGSEA
jgi:Mg/Co/Ni transporter MgtE